MSLLRVALARPETSVVIGTALVVLFFTVSTDGAWLSTLPSVFRVTAQVGLIAIGQAFLMSSGEIDLSVGSTFAVAGLVAIWAMDILTLGVAPAFLVALAASSLIGLVMGIFTVHFRVPSMIVTLGALFVLRGIAYIFTQGFSLSIPREFRKDPLVLLAKAKTFDLNNTFIVLLVATVIMAIVLSRTRFGSHVLAVGGDANAALANGISPSITKIKAFMVCSAFAGLSGILVLFQEGSVYSTSGIKLELEAIAAAVIGGCTLRGGSGSIWGPVLGVFVLSSLKGGLMMLGAPTSWYIGLVGALLIGFLIVSRIISTSTQPAA